VKLKTKIKMQWREKNLPSKERDFIGEKSGDNNFNQREKLVDTFTSVRISSEK
jgi:hypothetical protein